MNQENAGRSLPLPEPLAKRRRGRPRKDENLPPKEKPQPQPPSNYLNHAIIHQAEIETRPVDDNRENKDNVVDEMVGQKVSGVIEGSFDTGYLVAVKTQPIDTVLRGVVFHPGRVCSVTAVNDIAPLAKMHPRKELLLASPENVNQPDQSKNIDADNENKNDLPNVERIVESVHQNQNQNQFQDVMQNQIFPLGREKPPQFGIGNSFITMLTTDATPFPAANPPFPMNQQNQSGQSSCCLGEQQTLDRLFSPSPHLQNRDRSLEQIEDGRELVDERKGIEDHQESGGGNGC